MSDPTLRGLTAAEVAERVADGRVNDVPDAPVRTTREILRANVLTPVNAIMGTLLVLILVAGFPGDALFAGVIVSNSVIGVVQELRARRTLSELAVLSAPKARVVRDGEVREVGVSEVVADDVLALSPGDQVVVDGEVVDGLGLTMDESLLTGESDAVDKAAGDEVLSGSFVAAGSGHYRATRIGADAYAATLADEARRFTLANSELRGGVNVILRWLTVVIPPASLLLLARLLAEEDLWEEALRGTVAAAVAMVPDGLVLLTSLSFIVGVVALAQRQALAKELASVELLARVDVLCLDKTGRAGWSSRPCPSRRHANGRRRPSPATASTTWGRPTSSCPTTTTSGPVWRRTPPKAGACWPSRTVPGRPTTPSRSRRSADRWPSSSSRTRSSPTPPRSSATSSSRGST